MTNMALAAYLDCPVGWYRDRSPGELATVSSVSTPTTSHTPGEETEKVVNPNKKKEESWVSLATPKP